MRHPAPTQTVFRITGCTLDVEPVVTAQPPSIGKSQSEPRKSGRKEPNDMVNGLCVHDFT